MSSATIDDFNKLDIRVGRVEQVEDFPEARKPAWKICIDFGGDIGQKWSSVQIRHYKKEELLGRLVLGVVNFPPMRIAGFKSEVLTLGLPDADGQVRLIGPDASVPLGGRLF